MTDPVRLEAIQRLIFDAESEMAQHRIIVVKLEDLGDLLALAEAREILASLEQGIVEYRACLERCTAPAAKSDC